AVGTPRRHARWSPSPRTGCARSRETAGTLSPVRCIARIATLTDQLAAADNELAELAITRNAILLATRPRPPTRRGPAQERMAVSGHQVRAAGSQMPEPAAVLVSVSPPVLGLAQVVGATRVTAGPG